MEYRWVSMEYRWSIGSSPKKDNAALSFLTISKKIGDAKIVLKKLFWFPTADSLINRLKAFSWQMGHGNILKNFHLRISTDYIMITFSKR